MLLRLGLDGVYFLVQHRRILKLSRRFGIHYNHHLQNLL
jgi:hypothetical protein